MMVFRAPHALLHTSQATFFCFLGVFVLGAGAASMLAADLEPARRLDELLPKLASDDPSVLGPADQALERMCLEAGRPGAESERRGVASALAARLGPETPVEARLLLVRQLQVMGRDEAVAGLGRLLSEKGQPRLWEAARRALEANPSPQALRALRKAYAASAGEDRAALALSLGMRKDFLSVGDLLLDAESPEVPLRMAALEALSRIGDRQAVDLFETALEKEDASKDGRELGRVKALYLQLASSMAEGDEGGAARRIYLRALGLGPRERCAGLVGLGRAGIPADLPVLLEALADADAAVRQAAREGLAGVRGATAAIARRLEGALPQLRKDLLAVLARRGDPAAEAQAAPLASDPDPEVRQAALEALGAMKGEQALPLLLRAQEDASEEVRAAAGKALAALPGEKTSAEIAQALSGAAPAVRAALLRVLRARGGAALAEAAQKALTDPEAQVRAEAYLMLEGRAGPEALRLLVAAVEREEGGARAAARRALATLGGEEAAAAVLEALRGKQGSSRAALLECLAGRQGAAVREALLEALKAPEPEVRLAALRALARSDDAEALAVLPEAAREASGEALDEALRGVLRLAGLKARQGGGEERRKAASLYLQVLRMARDDGGKRAALGGLGEVGDLEALEAIRPFLAAKDLRRDAGRAAVRLGARIRDEDRDMAVAVFRAILQADPDEATARQCVRNLRRMGVEIDSGAEGGMVTRFWVLGPIPAVEGKDLLHADLPPEKNVALEEEVRVGQTGYRWKKAASDDPRGTVDLAEAAGQADRAAAYLYVEVEAEEAREALFKMGSDDALACFLNGGRIHLFEKDRAVSIDEDVVPVSLRKGPNRILLKVVNHGGGWGACLRITDREGKPLKLKQLTP